MHDSTKRLYAALIDTQIILGRKPKVEVAKAFNVSTEIVNNWERKGVSEEARLTCQNNYDISASWIDRGTGTPWHGKRLSRHIKEILDAALDESIDLVPGTITHKIREIIQIPIGHGAKNKEVIPDLISQSEVDEPYSDEAKILRAFNRIKDSTKRSQAISYIESLNSFDVNNQLNDR